VHFYVALRSSFLVLSVRVGPEAEEEVGALGVAQGDGVEERSAADKTLLYSSPTISNNKLERLCLPDFFTRGVLCMLI
jgi:hypothetical protein